jgi:nicotinamidase-related amidase
MERIEKAAHLCIDMQNIFAPGGLWETPWMERVLPAIEATAARYRERTIFSRFIPPNRPEERPGRWRHYFRRWEKATRRQLQHAELDLVREVARYVPPALVLDKPAHSAFTRSGLYELLVGKHVETVVTTGCETDVCVLATALGAVDLGFRVVIVEDALCSSSDDGHDALMTMYRTRLHKQIDLVKSEEPFEIWLPE